MHEKPSGLQKKCLVLCAFFWGIVPNNSRFLGGIVPNNSRFFRVIVPSDSRFFGKKRLSPAKKCDYSSFLATNDANVLIIRVERARVILSKLNSDH